MNRQSMYKKSSGACWTDERYVCISYLIFLFLSLSSVWLPCGIDTTPEWRQEIVKGGLVGEVFT